MANARAKAERSKAKSVRQGIIDQHEPSQRSKKDRPVVVEWRARHGAKDSWYQRIFGEWRTWGRYRDTATAEAVIAKKQSSTDEFRIKPNNKETA